MIDLLSVAPEVAEALAAGRPVVALESSVVAQGLPPPANLEAAARCAAAIRARGAVPATVALLSGRVVVGASAAELARLADPSRRPAKAGARDLAALLAAGRDAGTTVSATAAVAALAGIRLFATGGIGGVHRTLPGQVPAAGDVSADLAELARSPVCVVSAGPKAILDLAATAEVLESLGVPLLGFRTSELPAFYSDGSGVPLAHRVESAAEAALVLRLHWLGLGRREGVLLCVPPPAPLPRAEVEAAVAAALARAQALGVAGQAVTPFLLGAVAQATAGRAQAANLALLERNAEVAAEVAVAFSAAG
ncbi:MAG: pseudouridine-5'-phosphate glycosidase [Anaeromyxobacter sp.]|nr:pseudouridine-5'-phosphate glycosidase [Anaeromyxobacter sp.]MBL0277840.1 pseudouridine-5'-phosphate glycosidase [Anaeromyxobacter sp.]